MLNTLSEKLRKRRHMVKTYWYYRNAEHMPALKIEISSLRETTRSSRKSFLDVPLNVSEHILFRWLDLTDEMLFQHTVRQGAAFGKIKQLKLYVF